MFRTFSLLTTSIGILVCLAVSASAQTTTASETKRFEVIAVDGNQLVVKLPEGTKEISVPPGFVFTVDGKQMSVQDLKPGMKGTATITTTTTVTPVTATEVKNGQVVLAAGGAIYVRTDGDVKMFTQGDIDKRGVKIMRGGQPATVADFRPGDTLSATIITEKPPRVVTEQEVQATLAKEAAAAPSPAAAAPSSPAPTPESAVPEAPAVPAAPAAPAAPASSAAESGSSSWWLVVIAVVVLLAVAAFIAKGRRASQ